MFLYKKLIMMDLFRKDGDFMRKNLFSKAMAMLLSAGLVCTTLPVSPVSAEEAAVNAPAEQVLSLSTTTTTTTTPATEPVIDMCYSTLVEYDRTELAVGDVMEVRFWNPETGECSGGDISEVSDNISYEYEEDTGTIYITALSAGVGKMYVREYTCAFGAYVTFNVTDGQITTATSASTTTTAFTGTMTIPPAETTVATTLRTTETISPDETELTVEIDTLENCAEADFGQSLENVYSVMFEFDNVSLSDEDRVYLRFDVDNGVDYYQVLYPMSIFSSSTDKWWSEVQLANSFSYAIVRLPEGGWGTVSWLDVDASDVSDMLFDAVKTSDKAVFEIVQSEFEDTPVFTGTTADTADTVTTYTTTSAAYTGTTGTPPQVSLFWGSWVLAVGERTSHYADKSEFTGNVISIAADSGGEIVVLEEYTEYEDRIEFTVNPIAAGNDILRFVCDDGSEYELKIEVFAPPVTTTATTVTTSSTTETNVYDYTIPAGQSVTIPVYYEDVYSTVETVTVDGGDSVLKITQLEYLTGLGNIESLVFNIHVLTIAPGEDIIRLSLDNGNEFTIKVIVTEALTTSATTATTVSTSNTSDTGNTTLPTTYYSTTFPTTTHRTTTTPPHTTVTTTTTSTVPTGTNTGAGGEETGTTVGTIATTGTTVEPDTGRHNADANNDGSIDLDDAVAVLMVYANNAAGLTSEDITEKQTAYADADGDGKVTLDDAVKILTYYSMKAAGLQPSWADII